MPEDVFTADGEAFASSKMVRDWLRKPFKPEQIGKLPKTAKRPELDYVGHAAVTDRLNRIAPDWHYTIEQTFQVGEAFWLRGTMIVGGIARPEFGDGPDPKQALGNFIRRGAMRFGVALDLWSREELEFVEASGAGVPVTEAPQPEPSKELASDQASASGSGKATAGTSGGGADPSSGHHYPADPATCDHKRASGADAKFTDPQKVERCAKCGLPWIVVVEGTTADLGPA